MSLIKVVPGRMSMLLITLLVVINLFNAQPKRKFTTKLDEYLLLCIVFIVGAVLEYALVLAIMEYDKSVFFLTGFSGKFPIRKVDS